MPRNQFQRMFFAFVTVLITVHAYVFFSLYVINGNNLMAWTKADSVLDAIRAQGGVMIGSPCSFKLACQVFDPRKEHPVLFETAMICATVGIMCPAMSFIAAFLYYPYTGGFHIATLLANWLKLVCFNFPFAFFTQLFFIQPLVRTVFKLIFRRDVQAQKNTQKTYA